MGKPIIRDSKLVRQARVRRKLKTVAGDRLRLVVFRSNKHIYAQVIDDHKGQTLVTASTLCKDLKGSVKGSNVEAAMAVGKLIAKRSRASEIKRVVFDRGMYPYHGKIKALAEGARQGGLEF